MEEKYADRFHACLDSVAKEKQFLLFQEAPPLESTRAFVKDIIETGQVQFVALDDERVVGWCDIITPKPAALSHVGSVGMGLLPEYRGKGIGRAILTTAIQAAFASRIERIELLVYESNQRALGLYKSLGFMEEGRMARKAKIDGTYLNMVCMALFK